MHESSLIGVSPELATHSSQHRTIVEPQFHEIGKLAESLLADSDSLSTRIEMAVNGRLLEGYIQEGALESGTVTLVVLLEKEDAPLRLSSERLCARFRFTRREAEVALLLAERRSNKEIARSLAVTVHTAERHTERVLSKLGVSSRRYVRELIEARSD